MIKLCDESTCTQCYSCLSSCVHDSIAFTKSNDGFYIPIINSEKCVDCGLCVKSCHILTPRREKKQPFHTYAGWNRNLSVRKDSSSGGVFSCIATYCISQGGVVYGATMDENLQIKHIRVDSIEDLAKLRGSKYVQSNLSGVYKSIKEDLKKETKVLFIGSPCQVAGLYAFLKRDYNNLLTIDFVCHGVPSQETFNKYLKKIHVNKENTKEVIFRYKKGWGMQMSRVLKNGDQHIIPPNQSFYLKAFLKGMIFSEACYNCHYSVSMRVGDITIGDFWEIGKKIPFNADTRDGISLLLCNTEVGDSVLKECKDLQLIERTLQEAIEGNPNLHSASVRPCGNADFSRDLDTLSSKEIILKYGLHPNWKDYLRPYKRKLEELFTGHSK